MYPQANNSGRHTMQDGHDISRAIDALHSIPPDLPRDDWLNVAMAAQSAGIDLDAFKDWSAPASNYNDTDCRDMWRSIKPGKGIGAGTLFKMATEYGWRQSQGRHQRNVPESHIEHARRQASPAPRADSLRR